MSKPKSRPSFARRIAAARPREKKYCVWDDRISGLGVCIYPTGARSFFLRRKPHGKVRSVTLGRVGTLTVAQARQEARRVLPTLTDLPRDGGGPRYPARPMPAFAEEFLERHARHWRPSTLESNAYLVRKYVVPAFADRTVDAVTAVHVRDWFASLAGRPGVANRTMPVLSVMMRMAEVWGYRLHNTNPCKRTRRYPMAPMERYLSPAEFARLNAVLGRDEFYCPHIVAIVRLLMLTGCRFGEIAGLQWDWIRGRRIRLPQSKSGPRTVYLCGAARAVIDAIPRYSADCPFLFPSRPPTRPVANITSQWVRIRGEAGLGDVRLHDLRHSWASMAAMNGVDMVTIAKLLGHALVETTERYTHLSERSAADAADRVSARIASAMTGTEAGPHAAG